ncbi:MAG: hypothetical protein HQK76_00290 [Desulfobacterales bacterium]|nr:hypothetical protein [Desulfobacterales bacterium]
MRFNIKGKICIELLGNQDKIIGKYFEGGLSNVSVGGAGFYLNSFQIESARLLLGRKFKMLLMLSKKKPVELIEKKGIVMAIKHKDDQCILILNLTNGSQKQNFINY